MVDFVWNFRNWSFRLFFYIEICQAVNRKRIQCQKNSIRKVVKLRSRFNGVCRRKLCHWNFIFLQFQYRVQQPNMLKLWKYAQCIFSLVSFCFDRKKTQTHILQPNIVDIMLQRKFIIIRIMHMHKHQDSCTDSSDMHWSTPYQ